MDNLTGAELSSLMSFVTKHVETQWDKLQSESEAECIIIILTPSDDGVVIRSGLYKKLEAN